LLLSLFNDFFSGYIASKGMRSIRKGNLVAYFKMLCQNLPCLDPLWPQLSESVQKLLVASFLFLTYFRSFLK